MITLSTLAQATEQQVFDQVKNHLLSQKGHSIEGGVCKYRGPSGMKCAVGCLMSDQEYKPDMENNEWRGLIRKGFVPGTHASLITILQNTHDNHSPESWTRVLKRVAESFSLKY